MIPDERSKAIDQSTQRRRRARDGILDALTGEGDPTPKDLLRIMLVVVEEIGDKIDAVLANERGLRETVLNGHAAVHHDHHEWIAQRMESRCADACQWALAKMEQEAQDKKDAAEIALAGKRQAVQSLVGWVVTAAVSSVAGAIAALHFFTK
jgi:hypothetical protein